MSKNAPPPPEPLPESIVLGLNAWNCASKISPANWETKLNEQVNINNGDSIFVKASYIDTRGTASQNIELAVDTEISLEYYFYWMHTFNACNGNELFTAPTTPDASGVLTQQVLVGGTFQYQIGLIGDSNNVMGYYTSNGAVTNLNDADGLPYLVCQMSSNYVVPPVIGTSKDASNIVVGNIYLVTLEGLTTNWQYAGISTADYNKLPAGWDYQTSYFTATNNPQIDLPTSAFIPAALAAPLPYITYQISTVGNTDWIAIDPGLASNQISALDMVNGGRYAIATTNPTWNFEYWGASSNTVGTVFTATIPPALPMAFPATITTAIFKANAATWFFPNGGPVFGADPTDAFDVVIGIDPDTNLMVLNSVSGSGPWLAPTGTGYAAGGWGIPNSYFGFSMIGTPLANPAQATTNITNIASSTSGLSVTNLHAGTTYTVLTTGTLDGSVPQFTWDMVGNFPKTTTQNMTTDDDYQVIAPQDTNLIAGCAQGGLVSELFTSLGGFVVPASQEYDDTGTSDPQISVCSLTNEQGTEFMNYLITAYSDTDQVIYIVNNTSTGGYDWVPASVLGSGSHEGSPFSELPTNAPYASQYLTLVIPPNIQSGSRDPITFTASLAAGQFDEGNVHTMVSASVYPQPQNLIQFNGVNTVFTATGSYTGTGTTATVGQYTLATCDIDGSGYTPPMVEASVIEVGTIVHAINPDPDLPNDQGGRANVYAYQAGSTTPYEYDGYVADYTPATTKFWSQPVKKRWAMTLKAGSYDPNYLAELITRNMSRQKVKLVNNITGSNYPDQTSYTVPTDSIYNNVQSGNVWADPISGGSNTFYDAKNPLVYERIPPELNYNLPPKNNDDMPFLFTPAMNSTALHNDSNDALQDVIWSQIPHQNANGLNNLPNGAQYYVGLVPLLNDVKSVSPTVRDAISGGGDAAGKYSILPFYSQNSLVAGTPETGNSGIFPIVYGATQTSLIYNYENNGLFTFNYLHSPINAFLSTATNDLTECTAHMYTTQKVSTNMNGTNYFTTLIDKKSGILLHKMEPASFWNQLGFDIPAVTVNLESKDDNVVGFLMSNAEFQSRTTGGFAGSSNIFNQTFHTANSADQPNVPDTELIYLTATPAAASPADIIVAFTPNLTPGTSYKVYSPGYVKIVETTDILDDWSSIGGPIVDTGQNMAGSIFTATTAGFDPNTPPDGYISWVSNPTVVLANTPTITTTQLQNNYFQVTNTNTINAAKIPTQRDQTGHYLIEITGYNSIYLDDQNKKEIKSIVSSYYIGSAGSFVSQPFPDSYNYYHVGAPISLSNIKVRILDPYTNQEAQIGPNSSVYLQVNKLLTPQAIAQIEN